MSEPYDTKAWMVDALTDYTALECMPKETVEMMRPGKATEINMNDILPRLRHEISRNQSKQQHFDMYAGKYEELHPKTIAR